MVQVKVARTPHYRTREEAAEHLRTTRQTLDRWASRGTGPRFALVGGRALYTPDDLDAWVEAHMTGGDAA